MHYAWRIASVTPDYSADDVSGAGAKLTGGRWNRPGHALLYCATSRALAGLETVVHLGADLPLNRYLVRLDIPDALWQAREIIDTDSAPAGWDALPAGKPSLDFGDAWLSRRQSVLLQVPSIVVPEESNLLINTEHPAAAAIRACIVRQWRYDSRL